MTILTIPEVARILRVTPKVVREQCAKGCLPARKIGGSWRIEESLLAQWFQSPEAACPSFGEEKSGGSISLPRAGSALEDRLERIRRNSRKSTTTGLKRTSGSSRA